MGTKPAFTLRIYTFVLYATDDGAWTEADAEDRLDDMEEKISAVIDENQVTANWEGLTIIERSVCSSVIAGGLEYRTEIITVLVE